MAQTPRGYSRDRGDAFIPPEGHAFNPLNAGEIRNYPCICGSGKKIKRCCGSKRIVPQKFAEYLNTLKISQNESLIRELAAHSSTPQGEENGEVSGRP